MANVYFVIITFLFTQCILFSQNQNPSINSPKKQVLTKQAGQGLKFEHISTKDGFASGGVDAILQDHLGMMWFATRTNGLAKYDGYNFTYYKNSPGDSTSLSNNDVYLLYEDCSGQIWIGTYGYGLCRFNRETGKFTRYISKKNDLSSLSNNVILSVLESKINNKNTLWIGTGFGLNRYNTDTDTFTRYYPDKNKEGLKSNVNYIYSIIQDSTDKIWIGTFNEGLYYYNSQGDRFVRFKAKKEYSKLFKNKNVFSLCAAREGNNNIIWMGTYTNGLYKINIESGQINHFLPEPNYPGSAKKNSVYLLHPAGGTDSKVLWVVTPFNDGFYRFDTESKEFVHFRHEPGNSASLSSNNIWAIMEDRNGILWLGMIDGVNKVNPLKSNFITFKPGTALRNGLKNGDITSFCESDSSADGKVIWIGTFEGLYKYVRATGDFTHFKHDPTDINSLSSDYIHSLIISQHSNHSYLWAGTLDGLNRINLNTGRIKRFYVPNTDATHSYIRSLCEDETGYIWMGTQSGFLYKFNPENEIFTRQSKFMGVLFCLHIDSFENLWMGGSGVLNKFHIKTGDFTRYRNKQENSDSISNDDIKSIFEDKNKNIWIGTSGGLNKYNQSSETFIHYTEKDGLPSDVVRGFLEDDLGNLWLSTDNGISKFDPVKKFFKNYDSGDGLHGDIFLTGSAYKSETGEMFFGGPKGFTMFHPDKIKENKNIPKIIISDFQIFNQSVESGKNSILKKQISDTRTITLPSDQSVFSFEFAALDYFNPQKNKYAYKMEGVNPDWVFTDAAKRFATYTNLDPGDYTFKVKGSNNDDIWNEEGTSIKVTILPPWWRTNLAYFICVLIIGFVIYLIWHFQMKRIRIKHELEMEHIQAEKYQEIDRLKSHFFANISHEFRTPLTLILSPIEQLIKNNFKGNMKEGFVSIRSSAKKLLRLVNQLLSLSKLEAGQMKLQVSKQNIIPVFKRIINLFSSLAERNKIDLNITSPESLVMYFDEEKIETILNNLLSNAFKFTSEGGSVEVSITPLPSASPLSKGGLRGVQISVSNTGPHIPKNQLEKIFDRFYQVESNNHVEGTGIGLSLTKDLIELHHGQISVESIGGEKTTFTILIPGGKENYVEEEIESPLLKGVRNVERSEKGMSEPDNETIEVEESAQIIQKSESENLPIVLIVEDNEEVRTYLRKNFEEKYNIIEAFNGKIGLQQAEEKLPDLIISDVMMPEMDGFEFCDKIKNEIITSHIPVILLTARATREDKLEGLKTGADDYLPKPFDLEELSVRIENLIKQRRSLKDRFLKEALFGIEKITSHPAEQEFIEKITHIINQNIDNADYNVDDFVQEIGMSRTQLFRKIKDWTNLTPHEFIQLCRLKKAAELLKDKSLNVTEAAFAVGFKTASHFIRSFKRQFGKTPKEFGK